jgi:hypothetical protein
MAALIRSDAWENLRKPTIILKNPSCSSQFPISTSKEIFIQVILIDRWHQEDMIGVYVEQLPHESH